MGDMKIVSLDLETAGLVPGVHMPLSIGAVKVDMIDNYGEKFDDTSINDRNSFYVQLEWDSLNVVPDALQINKLDIVNPPGRHQPFYNRSLPAFEGIHAFSKWLDESSDIPIFAMGKNVGSFDLSMLKPIWNVDLNRQWPFHYRSIDLNTLFITLAQVVNLPFDVVKDKITQQAWETLKVRHPLGQEIVVEHHALGDAWWNVYAWQECLKWFSGEEAKYD